MEHVPEDSPESAHGGKNDPFVTLRLVVIIVVPLIMIAVLTGWDQHFFNLFTDPIDEERAKTGESDPRKSDSEQGKTKQPTKSAIPRSKTPPP